MLLCRVVCVRVLAFLFFLFVLLGDRERGETEGDREIGRQGDKGDRMETTKRPEADNKDT